MTEKKILIGPAGEEIRTLLSNSRDPVQAIKTIQNSVGLNLPGIDDMYPLLDLCGYSRYEIHKACLDALNTETVKYIESPAFKLENFYELFNKTFPYIDKPYMQPIPMALLKKFNEHVSDDIILKIKSNISVFENCPMNIKQRIWKEDEVFFQQTMMSVLNSYHYNEELRNISLNLKPSSYHEMMDQRRSHPIILKIMSFINDDPKIYAMFIRMLKIVFKATPHPSICSLRVDILINFHSRDIEKILRVDECHHLIWSLDSCVRNQKMDSTILDKIKECFDDVKNGTPLYTEFAMILMDPLISNFLASCIMKWLRGNMDRTLPDSIGELVNYNAKLLNLAEHAPMAIANESKIPKLDKDLKAKFWDFICKLMADESKESSSLKEPEITLATSMLKRSDIARKVYVQYLLDRTLEGDITTLNKCLPMVIQTWPSPENDSSRIIYKETYLCFSATMIDIIYKKHLTKSILDVKWRQLIIENFLLKTTLYDATLHEKMIVLLTEYYDDPKLVVKLGALAAVIADWTEYMVKHGFKDEKCLPILKERYKTLVIKSNSIMNFEYGINSPIVTSFLSS